MTSSGVSSDPLVATIKEQGADRGSDFNQIDSKANVHHSFSIPKGKNYPRDTTTDDNLLEENSSQNWS